MKVLTIVGARPNFIKAAPLHRALAKHSDIVSKLVHTGQHSEFLMSGIFFEQLGLPEPDYFLGVAQGSQTQQTAMIMLEFEKVLGLEKPDIVVVVGDVTSTLACALVCVKELVKVVHIEAGLRSGDRSMPEEINRILTDSISDELFVTEKSAVANLIKENIPRAKIHWVGNLMIDSLIHCVADIENSKIVQQLDLAPQSYLLLTVHRPCNVDELAGLGNILSIITELSGIRTIVFPMHPRTRKRIVSFGLKSDFESIKNLKILQPQGYSDFLQLVKNAAVVMTDSGGIQEETTYLGVPCITLRENTERPVTVEIGTNFLLPAFHAVSVKKLVDQILEGNSKKGCIPKFWDGNAAERIVSILREKYINSYVCDK